MDEIDARLAEQRKLDWGVKYLAQTIGSSPTD
jgi:hypothetical protein